VQAIARRNSAAARQAMLDHLVAVEALVFGPATERPRRGRSDA
jgi:DNA-binding FadR family transcriptional regulator